MIRVTKPINPPPVLTGRGATAAQRLKERYDLAPAEYTAGTRLLTITRGIYAHASVVTTLQTAQHLKCCFCERKTQGDVEHFRPKGGYKQNPSDPLGRPGYYWLAYDWDNLFFACGPCNQRYKENLFPLRRAGRRAISHHDDLSREEPLLVHPSNDDPMLYIGFRKNVAYPVRGKRMGRTTIDLLQLNRQDLQESRLDHYQRLALLKDNLRRFRRVIGRIEIRGEHVPQELTRQVSEIREVLRAAAEDRAEYASMARSIVGPVGEL